MGRAIVREPAAFLMDEPLSNLDAKLRVDMRAELARLHERLGVTTIYVTHDQVEAMTLGTRVAVMRDGTIQQVDTPQTLYREPDNLFVAAFIGSPSMNLVEAELTDGTVDFAGFRLPLAGNRRPSGQTSGKVILGIRPQDFADARTADPGLATIEVEAAVVEELGSATHVLFTIDAPPVDVDCGARGERRRRAREPPRRPTGARSSPRRSPKARRCGRASECSSRSTPSRLHFFDAEDERESGQGGLAGSATEGSGGCRRTRASGSRAATAAA